MYIICGAATTVVSLVVYYLCARFIFDVNDALQLQITNVISWVLSVLFAFVTNKMLVFKSKGLLLKELIMFYGARISTLLIDMFLMYLFVTLCSFDDMFAKCTVSIVVIILNYIFGKKLVFRKEKSDEKV
ncbi:MAG: GtrA family protein [Clostridia bacterium]|nr:GtrA family protein [Clostridia bacterium]